MAYEMKIDRLYPEGETYSGAAEKFEAYLTGPPGQTTPVIFDNIIAVIVEWFPPEDKLIRIRIWRDIEPSWATLYKVGVIGYGSPINWLPIVAGLALLSVSALLTTVSWKVSEIDWKAAKPALMGLGIGLALLVLALAVPKPKEGEA